MLTEPRGRQPTFSRNNIRRVAQWQSAVSTRQKWGFNSFRAYHPPQGRSAGSELPLAQTSASAQEGGIEEGIRGRAFRQARRLLQRLT